MNFRNIYYSVFGIIELSLFLLFKTGITEEGFLTGLSPKLTVPSMQRLSFEAPQHPKNDRKMAAMAVTRMRMAPLL